MNVWHNGTYADYLDFRCHGDAVTCAYGTSFFIGGKSSNKLELGNNAGTSMKVTDEYSFHDSLAYEKFPFFLFYFYF